MSTTLKISIPEYMKSQIRELMAKEPQMRSIKIAKRSFVFNRFGFIYSYKGKFVECRVWKKKMNVGDVIDICNSVAYSRLGMPRKEVRKGMYIVK